MIDKLTKFLTMKDTVKKAGSVIEVSEKEMLEAFMAIGMSEAAAQIQVNLEKIMHSEVLIGNKLFKLKESKDEGKNLEAGKQRKTSNKKGNKKASKKS